MIKKQRLKQCKAKDNCRKCKYRQKTYCKYPGMTLNDTRKIIHARIERLPDLEIK